MLTHINDFGHNISLLFTIVKRYSEKVLKTLIKRGKEKFTGDSRIARKFRTNQRRDEGIPPYDVKEQRILNNESCKKEGEKVFSKK